MKNFINSNFSQGFNSKSVSGISVLIHVKSHRVQVYAEKSKLKVKKETTNKIGVEVLKAKLMVMSDEHCAS